MTEISGFESCKYLKIVVIPNGVTGISTFNNCDTLECILIPKSIRLVNYYSFDSVSLTDIYYEGNENEWNTIEFRETGWFKNATIHFNSVIPMPEPIDNYNISIDNILVTSSSAGFYVIDVALTNDIPENGSYKLIAAAYDNDKLIDISVRDIFSEYDSEQLLIFTEHHVDCIKLFAWKGLNDMRSLCDALTIDEADFITE